MEHNIEYKNHDRFVVKYGPEYRYGFGKNIESCVELL